MATPRRKSLSAANESPANPKRMKSTPKTPLDLLKRALGRKDATLLDFIPLNKVDYVEYQDPKCDNLLSHKIRIGSILDKDGTSQTLWAYMTREARKEGLPELYFYGSHPALGDFCSWTSNVVVANAELREEFQFWSKKRSILPIVLKACFILKGAELPPDLTFKEAFISELVRACRRYKGDSAADLGLTPTSRAQTSDAERSSPVSPVRPRLSMRKSEQRGRLDQPYEALLPGSKTKPNPSSVLAADNLSGLSTLTLIERIEDSENCPDGHERILGSPNSQPQLETPIMSKLHHGNRRDNLGRSPSMSNDSSTILAPISTSDPRLVRAGVIQPPIASPTANLRMQSQASNGPSSQGATTPPSAQHRTAPHPTISPSRTHQIPGGPSSMRALNAFLETHNKIQKVEHSINNIKSDISKVEGIYHQRRVALAKHIDVDVARRHEEDRRRLLVELAARQKKEVEDLKKTYAEVKKEQERETNTLRQQEQSKLADVEALRRDLDQKREGLSKEQLLAFFVAQQSTNTKRKREGSQDDAKHAC